MEQQQFKVSFSVGTKLMVSVVLLLFVIILFLNLSTIFLVREDKRAYTYQSQATEAVLAGRELTNTARHALDALRLALASFDPRNPITDAQRSALQSMLDNQSGILGISVEMVDSLTAQSKDLIRKTKTGFQKLGPFQEEDFKIPPELMKESLPSLIKNAYAFMNLSKVGKPVLIGIAMADLKLKSVELGIPVAIGYVALEGFGKDIQGSRLTVTDREGWVLFDSDPAAFFNKKNIADDPLYALAAASQLSSGANEYDLEGVRYLGSYVRPGFDLIVLSRTEWRKAMRATYTLMERYVFLGLMAMAGAVVFAILFAKTMTRPLSRLYEATKEVAAGNFDVNLTSKSRDEIGALSNSFVVMSRKISDLIQESIRKVHLENELAIASAVQQTLFPPNKYDDSRILIHSRYQSAAECGGDWWGFFSAQDKVCLMIADATGHGLPSALITASAHSCFSVFHKLAQEDTDFSFSPGAMLAYANRVVHNAAMGKIMMTFFTGVIDFNSGTLTYASAGHNPPWLFKKGKEKDEYVLKSLVSSGQRLGESLDVPPYEEKTLVVEPDDLLFLYTDGLMEGKSPEDQMYGKKRTRKVVESQLANGPERIIQELMDDFLKHNGGKPLDDDVTLAVAKMLSTGDSTSRGAQSENA